MSSVVLTGDTSGAGTITVPAVAGTFTATIGSATGTHYPFTAGTAVASTSGTSIDFTSIPSWVKRITVMFNGVSTNGSSPPQIQLGTSGGVQTTSYNTGVSIVVGSAVGCTFNTSGFLLTTNSGNWASSFVVGGSITFSLLDSSSGIWTASGTLSEAGARTMQISGYKSLSGTLDRVRITTVNGTDTFDAGSINILYE